MIVRTAFHIAFFRRVTPDALALGWTQLAALALATLLPPMAFAAATIEGEAHLAWQQLPGVLFHVPVMLIAATLLARLAGPVEKVPELLAGMLLAWLVIDALALAAGLAATSYLQQSRAGQYAFHYGPVAWLALAAARLAASLPSVPARRAGWLLAACALCLALPLGAIHRDRSLWSLDYEAAARNRTGDRDQMAAAREDAFYRQPELLRHALDAIQPGREGVIDTYFLGVAGYGHEDVFMREVSAVATLMEQRFGAAGRTVRLVNNPRTVLELPVASATSLAAALARMGEVMDVEEDVLVLFLTSHGSSDHELSVRLWPLELRQITPATLRRMLDESGIRHRVVIVSACYAGGFIAPLRDEGTLVITAAAPDRNSFGCSNENQWTWFGQAYFDEALRATPSFTRAFEAARPVIAERERLENFEPSNPQMWVGGRIAAKLEALERQLARFTSAAE